MANYNLVIDSKFSPFSYAELVDPILRATQAHQDVENQYGELAAKADVWNSLANEQTDPYAYKMYKTFANDLEKQAEQLAKKGLTTASRRNMLNMRARYSKEITPIEQAYAARQKQAEQQQQALNQDPTLLLSRRASTTSLDEYIKNPQLAYESYSGKLITAQAAQAASALAKEMQEEPRKWRSILGNSYYETMMRKGFSSQAVLQAIQDNPNAAPQLTRIVEDAIDSSGVKNWGDSLSVARAIDYAKQGLWSAVGETQYQTLENWRAKMAAEEAMKIRAERRAAAAAKAATQNQLQINKLAINPLNIYSNRELTKKEKDFTNNLKRYSKYFYVDNQGRAKMTSEGWKEYTRKIYGKPAGKIEVTPEGTVIRTASVYGKASPTDFRRFMDSIGAFKATKGKWQPGNLGNVWNAYVHNDPTASTAKYDASKITEFDYSIAGTQQGDMKDAIMTANRGADLKEVDYDSKSKLFKDTGDTITMKDLKSDKYKVTSTRFSPYGNTVMIQDDKGNVKRYRMPAGINTKNEQFRDDMMKEAYNIQQKIQSPNLSAGDRAALQNYYEEVLQKAYLYHSQLGVQNKVKEQEYNPYGY